MSDKESSTKIRIKKFGLFYKFLIVGLAIVLLGLIFFFTNSIKHEIISYNKRVLKTYARLLSLSATHAVGGEELNILFEEIIRKVDFPIILTNSDDRIQSWRNLDLPEDCPQKDKRERAKKMLEEIKYKRDPIPIYLSETEQIIGYIYYGDSDFIFWLRLIPVFEILIILGVFVVGFLIFGKIKSFEKQNIWLGMARETAHQLGTPLSSLLGWLQLLRNRVQKLTSRTDEDEEEIFEDEYTPQRIVTEMGEDVDHMSTVVNRFSEIGSQPKLELTNLKEITGEVIDYLEDRKPKLHTQIEIKKDYNPIPKVKVSPQLLKWALENLIKNSLEAIETKQGYIRVTLREDIEKDFVNIIVTDNGRGISPKEQSDIFSPGYTTKKRGWGLGLSLSKRIVEDFHNGKLSLLESKPYEKTTFIISLPISQEEEK